MAIDYTTFSAYPIQILGINESHDEELTALADFVISEIEYSGDEEDLDDILPYFVFRVFCESRASIADANTGESAVVPEFTAPDQKMQIRAWNIGAKKLAALCVEKSETANEVYQSQISMLW